MQISFVVIGYNEATALQECLSSIRGATLNGLSYELIYVDGGSQDNSVSIVEQFGVDKLMGGEKRRKAAENRNLGLRAAQGQFIQFIDGDMTLIPDWPGAAVAFLKAHPDAAAICGALEEVNPSIFYQALQIDWQQKSGEVDTCGGAAMWRRDILGQINGFPESVTYGEEPYLCWRVRNELGFKIFYLDHKMARHDLGYTGVLDYWRRNVRCGESYAEIAARCMLSKDRLWLREAISNLVWALFFLLALLLLIAGPVSVKLTVVCLLCLIFLRKMLQMVTKGHSLPVSLCYALHVYFSKLPEAWGEIRCLSRLLLKGLPFSKN